MRGLWRSGQLRGHLGAGLLITEKGQGPKEPTKEPARVTAVIPAYNEEATIGSIVRTLAEHPLVGEVVVVSDGSTDQTVPEAEKAGAQVISLPENLGKGAALRAGVSATQADVVLFLDADLVGLTPAHIDDLLAPVLAGETDMTVGLFDGGRKATELAQTIAPALSGQRALRRRLMDGVPGLDDARYGAEVALTKYVRKQGNRVDQVLLRNMTHQTKEEKRGLVKGFAARMKMYWEIAKYLADLNP